MMGWPACNSSLETQNIIEEPLWNGGINFHHLGLIIAATFGSIACGVSFYSICQHATHYLKPQEQRQILRILFIVPIFALVSVLSYVYYSYSVYYEVLRDCYGAIALSAFFSLMCHYIAPDLHSQKQYFRDVTPKPWLWPITWIQKCCGGENGIFRTPRSGLTLFNVIWASVFQYCLIKITMTIVAVATQSVNRYCEESLSPAFSHIWVMVISAITVLVAMYCIIQFYYQIRESIAHHSPFLQIVSIKLVIFLSFWQTIMISFLTSSGVIRATNKIGSPDIKIGIPNLLLSVEMAIFAILHLWAFPWRPYTLEGAKVALVTNYSTEDLEYRGGPLGIKALADAFNPWDLVKAVGRSVRWVFVSRKSRTLDPSYQGKLGTSFSLNPAHHSSRGSRAHVPEIAVSHYGDRYGSGFEDDSQQLLTHAQPNPVTSDSSIHLPEAH